MADKKLNEVSQLTDFDYALVVKGNDVAKVTKQQLATILGELVNDTYEIFSLELGVEKQIANGIGAYYICGHLADTISCIAVVNYYTVATLGVLGGLTFRVAERVLYATRDETAGSSEIRVKKIRTRL